MTSSAMSTAPANRVPHPKAVTRALRQENELARIDRMLRIQIRGLVTRMRAELLRSFRFGAPGAVFAEYADRIRELLIWSMMTGHLAGVARQRIEVQRDRKIAAPDTFAAREQYEFMLARFPRKRTLEELLERVGTEASTEFVLEHLRKVYGPHARGATNQFSEHMERQLRAGLARIRQSGGGVADFRDLLDSIGLSPDRPYMSRTLFRAQNAIAYSAGRSQVLSDPLMQEMLWGYEYTAILDDRVRPTHAAMDGVRMPKDHPIWATWTPPNGWNCRCSLVEVWRDEPQARERPAPSDMVVDDRRVEVAPDEGWDFNPGRRFWLGRR